MSGLLVGDKGNMLRTEEAVPGAVEALQHFLSNSTWNEKAVLAQVARDVDRRIGGRFDSCLSAKLRCLASWVAGRKCRQGTFEDAR